MPTHKILAFAKVVLIFSIALFLEIIIWPQQLSGLRPSWLVMILIYWSISMPNTVSVGTAFIMGILWDVLLGTVLGVHSLVLSITIYFFARYHLLIRTLSVWFQMLLIMLWVLMIKISIFAIEYLLHGAHFQPQILWGVLFSAMLWPWLSKLLQKIHL